MELLIDSHHGVYIPQLFIQQYENSIKIGTVRQEDIDTVANGPDMEWYWDSWADIIDNVVLIGIDGKEYTLYESEGDLWALAEGEEIPEM